MPERLRGILVRGGTAWVQLQGASQMLFGFGEAPGLNHGAAEGGVRGGRLRLLRHRDAAGGQTFFGPACFEQCNTEVTVGTARHGVERHAWLNSVTSSR